LACAYRDGDYWEPVEDIASPDAGTFPRDAQLNQTDDRHPNAEGDFRKSDTSTIDDGSRLYNEREREVGASGSGLEWVEPEVRTSIPARSDSGPTRQEPFVSYQPEERYWTDYLRIALPIAGLLLLLGVFWYWASSFIGDDDNDPGQGTTVAVVETPITAPSPTATVGTAVNIEAVNTVAPTEEPAQETAAPTATTAPSTENGSTETDDGFAEGDNVVVNDNDVNLRAEASRDSDIVVVLMQGDELTIQSSESVDDGEYVWWQVQTTAGDDGWIAGEFIQASGT